MRLTNAVAERIARRMRLVGFSCEEADVWKVYEEGSLDGVESLASRILNEFDEYAVEVPLP
jgi:hypothetical protein